MPLARSRRTPRRRPNRRRRLLLLVPALAVVAVLGGWLVDGVLGGDEETPRNLTIDGVAAGGLDAEELRATVEAIAARRLATPVVARTGTSSVETTAGGIGLTVDVDATVDRALGADAARNPLTWLRSFWSSPSTEPAWRVERPTAAAAVADLGSGPGNASFVEVRDGVLVAPPEGPTLVVDLDRLEADLLAQAGADSIDVEAALVPLPDDGLPSAAEELATAANQLTEAGIRVSIDGREVLLTKDELRPLVRLIPDDDGLAIALEPAATEALLRDRFPGTDREGNDAVFGVAFGIGGFVGGDPDVRCCDPAAAGVLLDALEARRRSVEIGLVETPRPRGREWAASMGVVEPVGTFTTRFQPGQARVRNIERIAELTRGVIIEPGTTFSVNEFVGRRTEANGFVSAGVIEFGVFTESVGGGISQYATTLFNAAFFAGLYFGEYQSHSIYISRYPYGREATLSYPNPDLQIVNSTPYGVLLWPTTTADSITVDLWSTRFATGEQTGQTEEVVGVACTRVITERTRTYTDGRRAVDTVRALYRPEGVRCDGSPSNPDRPATNTTTTQAPTTTVAPRPPTTPPPPPPPTTQPPAEPAAPAPPPAPGG